MSGDRSPRPTTRRAFLHGCATGTTLLLSCTLISEVSKAIRPFQGNNEARPPASPSNLAPTSPPNSEQPPPPLPPSSIIAESAHTVSGLDLFTNAMQPLYAVNARFYSRPNQVGLKPGESLKLFGSEPHSLQDARHLPTIGAVKIGEILGNDMCLGAVLIVDALRKAATNLGLQNTDPHTQPRGYYQDPFVEWHPHFYNNGNPESIENFQKRLPHYPKVDNNAAVFWRSDGQLVQDLTIKNPPNSGITLALRTHIHRQINPEDFELKVQVINASQETPYPLRRCIISFDQELFSLHMTAGPDAEHHQGAPALDYALGPADSRDPNPKSTLYQVLVSPIEGTIIDVYDNNNSLGGTGVVIQSKVDGRYIRAIHLARYIGRVGKYLPPGAPFGLIGNTGISTGPHVHIQVHDANWDRQNFFGSILHPREWHWMVDPSYNV